ncbi:radical SAM protein [Desulfobacula phenolica]|uniref:Wyosine [tRNA(Phe)-imidazoG37] synthetase, radical SAM superfamily n=1 Tax=Desulfobacula phenolica TaxID=90732 RepID=A0A1H2IPC8_9BACT|nr:radical SAM protein [Desulfobacula phenolica]SDU45825.1 Wyosine [tRNA(Phe)-imidazoG37] synthetase, radical SAM superfamily [Desulfobacula phenolica]
MQYHHIFGPVPSRRLGISLGVDLVTHKTCSLDCIYCECGKTTRLTMEQKEYVRFKDVKKELDHFWQHNDDPDYITFSGAGEPTLNSKLGQVIGYIKEKKPHINVAVLTNSTLFFDPTVRHALLKADLVVPSLDAVSDKAFARINRPGKTLDTNEIVKGIEAFAKEYKGKIWLEIFILPGINDSTSDLLLLKEAVQKIQPNLVQINTLDRPGTLAGIKPASRSELERAIQIIGFPNSQIIAKVDKNIRAHIQRENIKAAIVETIHRRPCTKQDLLKILGVEKEVIDNHITILEQEGKIVGKTQERGVFYQTLKDS